MRKIDDIDLVEATCALDALRKVKFAGLEILKDNPEDEETKEIVQAVEKIIPILNVFQLHKLF